MRVVRELPLSCIEIDKYPICYQTYDLAQYLQRGGTVPPIHVAKTESGNRICDGRHRFTAHKLIGSTHILCRFSTERVYR